MSHITPPPINELPGGYDSLLRYMVQSMHLRPSDVSLDLQLLQMQMAATEDKSRSADGHAPGTYRRLQEDVYECYLGKTLVEDWEWNPTASKWDIEDGTANKIVHSSQWVEVWCRLPTTNTCKQKSTVF